MHYIWPCLVCQLRYVIDRWCKICAHAQHKTVSQENIICLSQFRSLLTTLRTWRPTRGFYITSGRFASLISHFTEHTVTLTSPAVLKILLKVISKASNVQISSDQRGYTVSVLMNYILSLQNNHFYIEHREENHVLAVLCWISLLARVNKPSMFRK